MIIVKHYLHSIVVCAFNIVIIVVNSITTVVEQLRHFWIIGGITHLIGGM